MTREGTRRVCRASAFISRREEPLTNPVTPSWQNNSRLSVSVIQRFPPLSQRSLGFEPSCLKKRTSCRSCRGKSLRQRLQNGSWPRQVLLTCHWTINTLSGFVSSVHTHDELSVQTQRNPRLGQAIAYIQSLVSARRPPEAMQVDLEKNDEDCDDLEARRIVAEFKRERDQACADIAERESRAMQEAKQKRKKQCGVSTPLLSEEVAPASP